MALQSSASINGRSYSRGNAFNARVNFTGKASSDGNRPNSTVIAGTTYTFLYYNPGTSYPYAIGLPGHGNTVRCWVQATVFPYATHRVSYNANGGSGAPGAQTKTHGITLKLSNTVPKRTGYTFMGWSTSNTATIAEYDAGDNLTENKSITLYAVWEIIKYTIIFDASTNGGTGNVTKTVNYGSSIKPLPVATKQYYVFNGWFTSPEGGEMITDDFEFFRNMTLYAQYVIDASIYIRSSGIAKPGFPYVRKNGSWKKGYAQVWDNNKWNQGIG